MSRKVYAVFGQTGEYSDQVIWPVAAYLDEEKAKDLLLRDHGHRGLGGAAMTPKSKKRKRARRKVRIANYKLLQGLFGFAEEFRQRAEELV